MKNNTQYIHKPLAITQHPQLSFAEQDYLCLIAQLSKRGGCIASNAWFARYFGVKPPRVSKVISSLAAKGFIKTTEDWNGKKVIKRTIEIVDEDINKSLIGIVTKRYRDTNEMESGDSNKMGEDKLNIKTKDKSKEMDSLFEHFWKAYPRKVSKPQALKAFGKLNPDGTLLHTMLDAIDRQRSSEQWSKHSGQFIRIPPPGLAEGAGKTSLTNPRQAAA